MKERECHQNVSREWHWQVWIQDARSEVPRTGEIPSLWEVVSSGGGILEKARGVARGIQGLVLDVSVPGVREQPPCSHGNTLLKLNPPRDLESLISLFFLLVSQSTSVHCVFLEDSGLQELLPLPLSQG